MRTPRGALRVRSKLVGRPNVYNILAAVATATALDLPFDAIERGVAALDGVPDAFQLASGPQDEVTGGGRLRAHRRRAPQSARDGAARCARAHHHRLSVAAAIAIARSVR